MRRFARLKRFQRSETGSMSVEAVLIFPILLWAFAAMFIYWDAFKAQNLNLKASYTVADLVSREVVPITPEYVGGLNDIYTFLVRRFEGNDLRVSVVNYVTNPADPTGDPVLELEFSQATGSMLKHTDAEPFGTTLPTLTLGDQLIVVETEMTWSPPINFELEWIGLSTRKFANFVVASPRRNENVCWDGDANRVCDKDETGSS